MNKKYSALCFFDLDGTLLNATSDIDQEVIDAVHALKEKNVLPIIATGRSIKEVRPIMEKSGITAIASLNGQYIEIDGEKIYESCFSKEVLEEFLAFSLEHQYGVCFYNTFDFWAYEYTADMQKVYDSIHSPLPATSKTKHLEKDVHMILSFSSTPELDQLHYDKFPQFSYFRNSPYSIDITQENNSKASGVKRVLEALHLEGIPTYAFGDGRNDLPLLEAVDHAIAMGNAIDDLKEIAEFVTTKNTAHGIVNGLKHFGLIG